MQCNAHAVGDPRVVGRSRWCARSIAGRTVFGPHYLPSSRTGSGRRRPRRSASPACLGKAQQYNGNQHEQQYDRKKTASPKASLTCMRACAATHRTLWQPTHTRQRSATHEFMVERIVEGTLGSTSSICSAVADRSHTAERTRVERHLRRPLARPLLARRVEDLVQQETAVCPA